MAEQFDLTSKNILTTSSTTVISNDDITAVGSSSSNSSNNSKLRVGIMTSGGDCPGLNAVIRAVIAHARLSYRWQVLGIPYGTHGLATRQAVELNAHVLDFRQVDPLLYAGGTILKSLNKPFPEDTEEAILSGYQALQLDALIVIGGDGSQRIIRKYSTKGNWRVIGVPKTIDNDVGLTEKAVGFDTAVNTITEALYKLSFTAASHDRVMVVEVMGRDAGHLALHSGIASGADAILLPEIPFSIESIYKRVQLSKTLLGRQFALVVVAEGARTCDGRNLTYIDPSGNTHLRGIAEYVASELVRVSDRQLDSRVVVLGHVQRGGVPSAFDRVLASAFGAAAVDAIAQGKSDEMVAWQSGKVVTVPLADVVAAGAVGVAANDQLLKTAASIGVYIGESCSTSSTTTTSISSNS